VARDNSAGRVASSFPENAVENENWYSVLMSLDYIPNLCNPSARGVTSQRKPARKRGTDLVVVRGVPPFRSRETDVLKTPSGSEGAHSACAQHVEDFGPAKDDQRHHSKGWKEIE
jgi:hypothetical protein